MEYSVSEKKITNKIKSVGYISLMEIEEFNERIKTLLNKFKRIEVRLIYKEGKYKMNYSFALKKEQTENVESWKMLYLSW